MSTSQALQAVESQPTVLQFPSAKPIPEVVRPAIDLDQPVPPQNAATDQPLQPRSSTELAAMYDVNPRTVLDWLRIMRSAYPWLEGDAFRTGASNRVRYTVLFQERLNEFKNSGLTEQEWIASVHAANADKLPTASATPEAPAIWPEVLPQPDGQSDFSPLPPVDRTAASSLLHTGRSFLDAMGEEEQQLDDLEARELELLDRMHGSLARLQHNQAQWDRTTDLRRQRLLRQTRLEAAALATEMEAEFENTLHETQYRIRNGSLGKPPIDPVRSPSA